MHVFKLFGVTQSGHTTQITLTESNVPIVDMSPYLIYKNNLILIDFLDLAGRHIFLSNIVICISIFNVFVPAAQELV